MNELIKDYGNNVKLYEPFNSYDMNYHLIENGTDGLVDIDDISIYLDECNVESITDIDLQSIKELIWKVV